MHTNWGEYKVHKEIWWRKLLEGGNLQDVKGNGKTILIWLRGQSGVSLYRKDMEDLIESCVQ
jgi:hypothetical protein